MIRADRKALSNCLIEMCTLLPVDGGFVHYADRFLDPAVGFSLGCKSPLPASRRTLTVAQGTTSSPKSLSSVQNSLVCLGPLLSPLATDASAAFNIIVAYWDPTLNPAICIATGLVLLVIVQVVNVRVYGESGEVGIQEARC